MKNRTIIILAFLSAMVCFLPGTAWAQKKKLIDIESVVKDAQGNPVANVEIFSNNAFARSDASGRFALSVEPGNNVIVEAVGYETQVLTPDEIRNMNSIALQPVEFKYGSEALINLAFRKAHEGDVVGAVSKVKTNEIKEYDNSIWASDVLNGRTLGMLGSNNIRGLGININVADLTGSGLNSGNALFIVDGLPRDIESLRLSEIESITVLKDVNASVLYGSAAVNGVVLITTKRGEAYKKVADITANYGISTPRALPKYLNSADYMTYYNKAKESDGLEPAYPDSVIQKYRSGNKYRYPDVDYYSSEYLNKYKSYFDLMGEFGGGNDVAKYYSNIGWYSAGSIIDFGDASTARNNVFNVRGNVDLRINNWIKTSIDGSSIFGNNRSQRGSYWAAANDNRPYEFAPLLPFDLIDPENPLLKARKNEVDGQYILGGNSTFITNAIADAYAGGVYERVSRKFSFNNRVDFDLKNLTEGLSFHTNISFDYYTRFDQTVANEYSVYEPFWDASDKIDSLVQHGKDARPGTQSVGNTFFHRRFGFYGLFSYDRTFDDLHHFTGSLTGYGSNFKEEGNFQGVVHSHAGMQVTYAYDRKYMVDFSSAYVNSVKLGEGQRGGFSPTLALGWKISGEDFLSSSAVVDYLKLKVSAGILNSDFPIGNFFYYDNRYGTSGSYAWNEGVRSRSGVMSSWSDNPGLDFAQRKEINLGLIGLFFDKSFGLDVNLFYDVYDGLVTRPSSTYPGFWGDFIPYENFGINTYKGIEAGVHYDRTFGDWNIFAAVNALYVTSKQTKVDELWAYDYQFRKGQPVDATFGLEATGLFQDQAEIDNSPRQLFGTVRPGDIKYKDQNGDNVIDSNDEVYLRRWQAPFSGGAQLKVSYKNLTLYMLGEGRMGSDTFRESDYYWIDGNEKYSEIVKDAWTPQTKGTATHPRISTVTNNNNHRRSSFWLYNNDYFSITDVQLTYHMPSNFARYVRLKNLKLFIDASDVYQIAPNREIRDLRTGNEPYYRTFSVGLKADF